MWLNNLKVMHGQSKTKLYYVWQAMKNRCYQPSYHANKNYRDRGIEVCKEWINSYETFMNWACTNGYTEGLSIDRIDTNGNYEPPNCRWVNQTVQNNNQWDTKFYTYKGITDTLPYLCKRVNVDCGLVRKRISKGFSLEMAVEMPRGKRRKTYYRGV